MKPARKGPKRSGRRRLPPEEKRTEIVEVRLSPRELARIKARADQTRQGVSTFLREAALKRRIIAPPSFENLKASVALKNSMNNLNQAVRAFNSGLEADVDRRIIHQLRSDLRELRLELLRRPR
jgi:hypothetical protein